MINQFNVWVGCSEEFKDELVALLFHGDEEPVPAVSFPLLNTLTVDTVATLKGVHDQANVQRLFKSWQPAAKLYKVWSFYASKPPTPANVVSDFQALEAAYPQDFAIMGAWHAIDGREVGKDTEGGGTATFPQPAQLINFMPDVWNGDEPPTFSPATVVTDINLLAGQAQRDFT